jgi:hypothetical protein
MSVAQVRMLFLIAAVSDVVFGLLFLTGTWDGLYDALELPQGRPAIFVQVGGAVLCQLAYLYWIAARTPALMAPVARGAALAYALTVIIIVAWMIHGLEIGTLGDVLLIATAAASALFAVLFLKVSMRPGGYGPEPPLPPSR